MSAPFTGLSAQRCRPAVDGGLPGSDNHLSHVYGASRCSASAIHPRRIRMARNYYAELNLHVTWHTKESAPLLVPKVEAVVHHYLRGRCINTLGVFIHEIGGIETHVHLAISIVPTITISEFIGQLKGSSSHEANQKMGHKVLDWQTGYAVVSFGTGDLEWVRQYIRNQRDRHAGGCIVEPLERIAEVGRFAETAGAEPREAR